MINLIYLETQLKYEGLELETFWGCLIYLDLEPLGKFLESCYFNITNLIIISNYC